MRAVGFLLLVFIYQAVNQARLYGDVEIGLDLIIGIIIGGYLILETTLGAIFGKRK
jgi:hypothetical protein